MRVLLIQPGQKRSLGLHQIALVIPGNMTECSGGDTGVPGTAMCRPGRGYIAQTKFGKP
jgi:hypothetical protein